MGGNEAVELAIYKEGDANTVATADSVAKRLEQVRAQMPPDMELTVIDDQSTFIRHAIADVKLDAVVGGILAILVIFLFLRDGWSTFVVALSLPVSIVTTFRSEEHTSELQSLMRISYAVFCWKKKK